MTTENIIYQFQASGADRLISAVKNINNENETLRKFLRELQAAFNLSEKGALSYAKSLGITGSNLVSYQQALGKVNSAQQQLPNTLKKTTGEIEKQRQQIDFLSAQYIEAARQFSTSLLAGTASDAIKVNVEFEKLRTLLSNVTNDAADAERAFQFLTKTSDDFGISLLDSGKGFAKLQASIGNLAVTEKVFRGVAAASRTFGLTQDEVNGSLLALSQIASKGAIQMEELRGQLGERLPGTLKLVAEALGTTTGELENFVRANRGNIVGDLDKIGTKLVEVYEKKGLASAKSLTAEQARFTNSLNTVLNEIGSKLTPIVTEVVKFGGSLLDAFQKLPEPVRNLIILVTGLTVAVGALALSLGALSLAAPALAAAFTGGATAIAGFLGVIATAGGAIATFAGSAVTLGGVLAGLSGAFGGIVLGAKAFLVASLPLIAAVAAIGVAVAGLVVGLKVAKEALNFESTLASLEATSAQASVITQRLADAGIRQNKILAEANRIRSEGGSLSKRQIADVQNEIRINGIYTKDLESQIEALKAKKDANGNLTAAYQAEIAVLERTVQVTKDKTSQLQALIAANAKTVKSLDDLSDAYDRNNAAIDEADATRQANIFSNVQSEEEANRQILASDITTAKARLTEQRRFLAELQALSGTQKAGTKEAEATEAAITKVRTEAAKSRISISKLEAEQRRAVEEKLLADLDAANKKAQDAIAQSADFRVEAAKRASIGNIENQRNEAAAIAQIELEASKARLARTIAEQAQLKAIRDQISPEEFNRRELALASEKSSQLLAIAKNETSLLKVEQEARLADIERTLKQAQDIAANTKIKLEFEVQGLEIQSQLIEAQQQLQESLSAIRVSALEQELEGITQAGELRKQYNELDTSATNQRAELLKQLAALGASASQSDLAALQARETKERQLADVQRQVLAQRQAAELAIFDIKARQQAIALQILAVEKQIAVAEAQAAVNAAQTAGADAATLANAQQRLELAQQAAQLAAQSKDATDQANAAARAALVNDQARAIQEAAKAESNRQQAAALEKAKVADAAIAATSAQVAANTAQSAQNAEQLAAASEKAGISFQALADSLKDVEAGFAGFTGGGASGISIKTQDPEVLLKRRLDLQLKLAKTEEERAAIQAKIAARERSDDEQKLVNLDKLIRKNNALLDLQSRLEDAAREGRSVSGLIDQAIKQAGLESRFSGLGRRFQGGDVTAGNPVIVGEHPRTGAILPSSEVFIPKVSGHILAAKHLQDALSQVQLPVQMARSTSSQATSTDRTLRSIDKGIGNLNKKVDQLQPSIKEVNINAPASESGNIVEKMMLAQLAARQPRW